MLRPTTLGFSSEDHIVFKGERSEEIVIILKKENYEIDCFSVFTPGVEFITGPSKPRELSRTTLNDFQKENVTEDLVVLTVLTAPSYNSGKRFRFIAYRQNEGRFSMRKLNQLEEKADLRIQEVKW